MRAARSSVYRWQSSFETYGEEGLCPQPRGRSDWKANDEVLSLLETIVGEDPRELGYLRSRWSSELLSLELARRSRVEVHATTVRRWLARLEYRYRRARPTLHRRDPRKAQRLQAEGADATAPFTVRQKLKNIVDGLDHEGFTPIVDTMYEAAKYYRGEAVLWGKQRGFDNASGEPSCNSPPHLCNSSNSNPKVRRNTRVSHPASWTGGTLVKPAGCTDTNLNAPECEEENVTGSPVYISPIEEACQANYIVLLTDGAANHNDSAGIITSDYGLSCSGSGSQLCGVELAEFLNSEDQIATLSGDQGVITYTIGFNFSNDFLPDMAEAGGGEFFTADTGAELATVFQTIIADILSRSTSFATPSLSVNAFNKLNS